MKKALKIKVSGKEYPVKFGYGCLKLLSGVWKCTLSELFEKLGQMDGREIECFVDIVWCALTVANPDVEFDSDAVGDFILANPEVLPEITEEFKQSLPQPKEAGKPAAVEVNEPQTMSPTAL